MGINRSRVRKGIDILTFQYPLRGSVSGDGKHGATNLLHGEDEIGESPSEYRQQGFRQVIDQTVTRRPGASRRVLITRMN